MLVGFPVTMKCSSAKGFTVQFPPGTEVTMSPGCDEEVVPDELSAARLCIKDIGNIRDL